MRSLALALLLVAVNVSAQVVDPLPPYRITWSCSGAYQQPCAAGDAVTFQVFDLFGKQPTGSFEWHFGDGSTLTTTTPNATHAYSALGNHTVFISAYAAPSIQIYITANPPAVVTSSPAMIHVSESAGSVDVLVTRIGNTGISSTVDYLIYGNQNSGDAPNKIDPARGTLTFAPGETSKTVTLAIKNDNVNTGNVLQAFVPTASDGTLVRGQTNIEVDDDDPPLVARINDIRVAEGNVPGATATFTITLDQPAGRDEYFGYNLTDGTAHYGKDFLASAPIGFFRVYVPIGSTTTTIAVPLISNTDPSPDKTFTVTISPYFPSEVVLARGTGTCTILNDDYTLAPAMLELAPGAHSTMLLDIGQALDAPAELPIDADRTVVDVAASVSLPAGASKAQFSVSGRSIGQSVVTVRLPNNASARATVSVIDASALVSDADSVTLIPGETKTIHLRVAPPRTADTTVMLSGSDGSIVDVPASVTIPPAGSAVVTIRGIARGIAAITASSPHTTPAMIDAIVLSVDAPRVERVLPSVVPVSGGLVTIIGSNLTPQCSYAFGGLRAAYAQTDPRGISVIAPPAAGGSVPLEVTCGSDDVVVPHALTYGAIKHHAAH